MALEFRFDTIASVYDVQRAHPPAAAAAIGQAVAGLVPAGAPILELGVGTGRIAIPTAAAGGFVTGIDVSSEMLRVAAERADVAGAALELVRADAQTLPFADDSFAAILAVHFLHLLSDWRAVLAESMRTLMPGGLFIQGIDWRDPDSCVGRLRGCLRQAVVALMPGSRPPGAGAAIAQALARYGGVTGAPVVAAQWVRPVSPAEVIEGMAARLDAETWVLQDDTLAVAMEQVRAWAAATWIDLTEPQEVEHRFLLTTTRFGGATGQ